ncbi:MAG: hypothetical protein U0893_09705 [Chloroflexota bacterium]
MMPMGIPEWNEQGVLPPIDAANPTSPSRSPYVVRLSEVVARFGRSSERQAILEGFLRYRAALQAVGLIQGFQWLDGSFLEDVEQLDGRPPNDIDVVTFFRLRPGESAASVAMLAPDLFPSGRADRLRFKQQYHVDGYLENLDARSEGLVARSTYWYSMWSHRRSGAWKGYLQVDLSPAEDADARSVLVSYSATGARS